MTSFFFYSLDIKELFCYNFNVSEVRYEKDYKIICYYYWGFIN